MKNIFIINFHKPKGLVQTMKLKKFLAAVIAAAASISTLALTSFAVGDGEAAYCFDNTNRLTDWQTYGSAADVGLALTQKAGVSLNGDGCLMVSESSTGEVTNGFGGAYISSDTFSMENFGGCTFTMNVMLCEGMEGFVDNFSLYSDGMIWLQSVPASLNSQTWTEISLTLPEDAANTTVGFTIPTFQPCTGDILYIDDFTITLPDGTAVENLGDYTAKTITGEDTVSTGTNVALTILLVVLILAIVGGIGLIVSAIIKKFA